MLARILFCLLISAGALGSDTANCRSYCSGGDFYTGGYKVCEGSECQCVYQIVPQAPECPQAPPPSSEKPKKQPD